MDPVTSEAQQRRIKKIERLRKYFRHDGPEIHEWDTTDEKIDFDGMSDAEIEEYLKRRG